VHGMEIKKSERKNVGGGSARAFVVASRKKERNYGSKCRRGEKNVNPAGAFRNLRLLQSSRRSGNSSDWVNWSNRRGQGSEGSKEAGGGD